jgi:hypothetical protein
VLVGAAEAGFFPGIIFYLTLWFPAEYRARIVVLTFALRWFGQSHNRVSLAILNEAENPGSLLQAMLIIDE